VINAQREAVGLIFDGNIEMLPNNFLYRSTLPRAVSVHSAAIIEALKKIYEANRVVKELLDH
ncbi:MAG: S46 family peptidase, partial [Planctomycetes bacterium]|nr:S46 family peptidase [Planctomycetota bacterium]